MNKVTLIGRWIKDVELKFTPGQGTAVVTGTLAVDRKIKKEGQPEADFIKVIIWGKQSEAVAQYCGSKGMLISVSGRIQTGKFDKNGVTHYTTDVVAEEVYFKGLNPRNTSSNTPAPTGGFGNDNFDFDANATLESDDSIPF